MKPRCAINLAAFNVHTLMKPGQQAGLALTLDSLCVDICCVSETRIQDPIVVLKLTAPNLPEPYFLRTSGDDEARAACINGVGVVLNRKLEAALLY